MKLNTDNYITVQEAANRLGVSRGAMYRAIRQDKIESVDVHGMLLIPITALEFYVPRAANGGGQREPVTRRKPNSSSESDDAHPALGRCSSTLSMF